MDRHYRYLFIRRAFCIFLAYEVTTLKVIIEFPVIFLLFGRKSADHFAEQFPVLEPTKPPAVIFQPNRDHSRIRMRIGKFAITTLCL